MIHKVYITHEENLVPLCSAIAKPSMSQNRPLHICESHSLACSECKPREVRDNVNDSRQQKLHDFNCGASIVDNVSCTIHSKILSL